MITMVFGDTWWSVDDVDVHVLFCILFSRIRNKNPFSFQENEVDTRRSASQWTEKQQKPILYNHCPVFLPFKYVNINPKTYITNEKKF